MIRSLDPKSIGSWLPWSNDLIVIGSKVQGVGRLSKHMNEMSSCVQQRWLCALYMHIQRIRKSVHEVARTAFSLWF